MTDTTGLDAKITVAARTAYQSAIPDGAWHADGGETDAPIRAAITAYLSATRTANSSGEKVKGLAEKLAEIRHQNEVNIEYARREHPKDNPLPPVFEVLAGHITDRLNEADALLASLSPAEAGVEGDAKPVGYIHPETLGSLSGYVSITAYREKAWPFTVPIYIHPSLLEECRSTSSPD